MASWVVMERKGYGRSAGAEDLVFVRDGFSFLAFLFPPFWLLWHRLWVAAALAFAAQLPAIVLDWNTGLVLATRLLSLLVAIFVGLEGNALRIAMLRRHGWNFVAVVDADSHTDAETRYADEADEDGDGIPDRLQITPSPGPASAASPVGLLLNPGN